jgi:hypothetical protein
MSIKKFVVAHLLNKLFHFLETESSLPWSQKPISVHYSEPVESNLQPHPHYEHPHSFLILFKCECE